MARKQKKQKDDASAVPAQSDPAAWAAKICAPRTFAVWVTSLAVLVLLLSTLASPAYRFWAWTVPVAGSILLLVLLGALLLAEHIPDYTPRFVVLLMVFAAFIYFSLLNRFYGMNGDNMIYLGSAFGMARFEGIVDWFRDPPAIKSHLSMGLGLFLLPSIWFFEGNVVALKVPVALCGIAAVGTVYLLIREIADRRLAVVVAFLSALNLSVLQNVDQIMTEVPYLFLSMLGLYLLIRYAKEPGLFSRTLVFTLATLWMLFHIKGVMYVMMIAAVINLALVKKWKKILVLGISLVILVLPSLIRDRYVTREQRKEGVELIGYTAHIMSYFKGTRKGGWAAQKTAGKSLGENVKTIVGTGLKRQVTWATQILTGRTGGGMTVLVTALIIIGLGLCVYDGFRQDRYRLLPHIYFGGMFLIYLSVGISLAQRYLMVLVPLYLCYIFVALTAGLRRIAAASTVTRKHRLVWGAVMAAVLFLYLPSLPMIGRTIRYKRTQQGYPGTWQRYYEAARWIAENGKTDKPVISRKSEFMYPWTNKLRGKNYPYEEDPQKMLEFLQRYDYILIDNGLGFQTTQRYVIPVINANMDKFRIVYRTRQPYQFVVQTLKPKG